MNIEYVLITCFIIINFFIIIYFDKIKFFQFNIDKPDYKRKLHKQSVPLAGGSIIIINLFLYFLISLIEPKIFFNEIIFDNTKSLTLFFFTSFSIFILGFLDDRFNYSANIKFFIISIIILMILLFDKDLIIQVIKFSFLNKEFYLSQYSLLFTCFCFLVFLNAFNMFDGINLQSSLYSLTIFLCIIIFYIDLFLAKIIIISLLGYSFLNYKNKTFLGDSGSLLISFIIGYIFIKLYNFQKINFADEVVIYMLVPGIDLIRLFFKRILIKKNPLTPDRFHLHHLLLLKYSYSKSLLILYGLITLPLIMNYFGINILLIIIFFIFIYSMLLKIVLSKN